MSTDVSGFQFLNFQAGLDVKPDAHFGAGPFVTFSLGQYDKISVTEGALSERADPRNEALHEWLTFGIRGIFDIAP